MSEAQGGTPFFLVLTDIELKDELKGYVCLEPSWIKTEENQFRSRLYSNAQKEFDFSQRWYIPGGYDDKSTIGVKVKSTAIIGNSVKYTATLKIVDYKQVISDAITKREDSAEIRLSLTPASPSSTIGFKIAAFGKDPNTNDYIAKRLPEEFKPAHFPLEEEAMKRRDEKCRAALKRIFSTSNPEDSHLPRIAMINSGGGWRAMAATSFMLDGLSQKDRLIDTISCIAGLSGGSWGVMNFILSGDTHGDGSNPFHQDPSSKTKTSNPWRYGETFDPKRHCSDGLARMLSEHQVRKASDSDSWLRRATGWFAGKVSDADGTILRVLTDSKLGYTWVERWSTFLADDLLDWLPDSKRQQHKSILLDAEHNGKYRFGDAILNGDFPMLVCSAISSTVGRKDADWVEFTPFGCKTNPRDIHCEGPFEMKRLYSTTMEKHSAPSTPTQIFAHHIVAMCGSAFALSEDTIRSNVPYVGGALVRAYELARGAPLEEGEAPVGETLTRIVPDATNKPRDFTEFGAIRDGGLEFNIPLPAVLERWGGRKFDIVIVNDASGLDKSSYGSSELRKAIELGYYVPDKSYNDPLSETPWDPKTVVKVFKPAPDFSGPILVYCMTLTERATSHVMLDRKSIESDKALIKRRVENYFAITIKAAIQTHIDHKKGDLKSAASPTLLQSAASEPASPTEPESPTQQGSQGIAEPTQEETLVQMAENEVKLLMLTNDADRQFGIRNPFEFYVKAAEILRINYEKRRSEQPLSPKDRFLRRAYFRPITGPQTPQETYRTYGMKVAAILFCQDEGPEKRMTIEGEVKNVQPLIDTGILTQIDGRDEVKFTDKDYYDGFVALTLLWFWDAVAFEQLTKFKPDETKEIVPLLLLRDVESCVNLREECYHVIWLIGYMAQTLLYAENAEAKNRGRALANRMRDLLLQRLEAVSPAAGWETSTTFPLRDVELHQKGFPAVMKYASIVEPLLGDTKLSDYFVGIIKKADASEASFNMVLAIAECAAQTDLEKVWFAAIEVLQQYPTTEAAAGVDLIKALRSACFGAHDTEAFTKGLSVFGEKLKPEESTPLVEAVQVGNHYTVEILLQLGSTERPFLSLLEAAVDSGYEKVAEALLKSSYFPLMDLEAIAEKAFLAKKYWQGLYPAIHQLLIDEELDANHPFFKGRLAPFLRLITIGKNFTIKDQAAEEKLTRFVMKAHVLREVVLPVGADASILPPSVLKVLKTKRVTVRSN